MKKILMLVTVLIVCICVIGSLMSKEEIKSNSSKIDDVTFKEEKIGEEKMDKTLVLTVNNHTYDVILDDTPAANSLYNMLPLDLTFEDFNNIEKIAYLEEPLSIENEPDGFEPKIGDFCLYAPWGNLSIFYKDFRYSKGLISLGHIDLNTEDLASLQDDFSARLEVKQ